MNQPLIPTLISVLVPVVVVGCFSGANVRGKHAAFHGCSSDDVTSTEVESEGHTQLKTSGCGHEETYFCIGMKCRSPRLLSISHFNAEYKCKTKEITAEASGENTFAVSGCGNQTSYGCKQVPNHVIECTENK